MVDNKQVIFKGYIERAPKETDMEIKITKVDLHAPKGSSSFLVKNLYLSCDPYMRGRMRHSFDSYIPPFVPGQAIDGFGVSKVVDSGNPDFKPGDLISGFTGWEEYSLIQKPQQLRKIQPDDDIPLSYHVGLLGMPGLTAYAGFYEVCSPKKGEYVFVSAAVRDNAQSTQSTPKASPEAHATLQLSAESDSAFKGYATMLAFPVSTRQDFKDHSTKSLTSSEPAVRVS